MQNSHWITTTLEQESLTDLCLNGAGEIYIDRGNGMENLDSSQVPANWSESDLRSWVLAELAAVGKSWDARNPFLDATLASGHRMHVLFPPVCAKGITVSLRKVRRPDRTRGRELTSPWVKDPFWEFLKARVQAGESLIVAGSTGSGKTTLVNGLLSEVSPLERIIALEDTPELFPAHPHFLSLVSRPPNADGFGEITLRTLLKQTLRMRPDRIVLGECRGDEVLELIQALNTGHRGSLCTLHANTPRDALRRIELLCILASRGALPVPAIRELLAHGIQWIAQVKRLDSGQRKITEVWRLEGREGDTILLRPVLQPETR